MKHDKGQFGEVESEAFKNSHAPTHLNAL